MTIMTHAPEHAVVWSEIPVSDLEKGMKFYAAITGMALEKETSGEEVFANFKPADPMKGVAGHLYRGKPAGDGTGPTIHLAAEGTSEEMMERVKQAGGTVVSPIIQIPPGRFFYATDPDGNSIGLFEVA
tara:strand:+ start:112 stop:498 length:387 start_codon:yes stop_codon:yes gene_type:complete